MATKTLLSWAPYLHSQIPMLPSYTLQRAVRDACQDFCEQTLLWTLDLTRISVVASQNNYTITIPAAQYAELISIESVKYKQNGLDDDQFINLDPLSVEEMNVKYKSSYPAWQFLTAPTPSHFYMEEIDNATLYLWRTPTAASTSGLLVNVALRPDDTTTVVPDWLYNKYAREIRDGALADLFNQRSMPWYDMAEAMNREQKFKAGIASAKYRKSTGLTRRPMQVTYRARGMIGL